MHCSNYPEHRAGKGNGSGNPAEPERLPRGRGVVDDEMEWDQGDPGKKSEIEYRKTQGVKNTARAGQQDETRAGEGHRVLT